MNRSVAALLFVAALPSCRPLGTHEILAVYARARGIDPANFPHRAERYFDRGRYLVDGGYLHLAVRDLRAAIRLRPQEGPGYTPRASLAQAYVRMAEEERLKTSLAAMRAPTQVVGRETPDALFLHIGRFDGLRRIYDLAGAALRQLRKANEALAPVAVRALRERARALRRAVQSEMMRP